MSFEQPTDEERPFVEAILDDLDDDTPRLVYADWLQDQGDPRGEFIRVQCELDSRPRDDPEYDALEARERALLKKHRAKWIKPLPKLKQQTWGSYSEFFAGRRWFRRGLVEYFTIAKPKAFELHAEELAKGPSRYVQFLEWSRNVTKAIVDSPLLPRLRGIGLAQRVYEAGLFPELDPERVAGLQELSAHEQGLDSAGLTMLLDTLRHTTLRALELGFNDLVAEDLDRLVAWEGFTNLRTLHLGLNTGPRDAEGILAAIPRLLESPRIAGLHELDLWGNDLGPAEAAAIASSPHLGRVVELKLNNNRDLGDEGVSLIARSKSLPSLRSLTLWSVRMGDEGAVAITESESSRSLAVLQIQDNTIASRGFEAIAQSPNLSNLRALDLSSQNGPPISKSALQAFVDSPYLQQIEYLNLGGAEIDDTTQTALKKRFKKAFTDDGYKSWSG